MKTVQQSDLDLLMQYGVARIPHSGATVLDHLFGTCTLLERWGSSRTLCLAGLYHGVYGTEGSPREVIPLSERWRVRETIGEEAEALVYLFCVGRRPFLMTLSAAERVVYDRRSGGPIAVTEEQVRQLIELEVANWVQLLPRYSLHDEMVDRFVLAIDTWRTSISFWGYRAILRALSDKYRQPPTLGRRAGHALTSRLPWLRKTVKRVRRWRDKRSWLLTMPHR